MPGTPLNRLGPDELPAGLKQAWDRSTRIRGDATLIEAFGNAPELFDWYTRSFYGEVFHGGRVSSRIKELTRFRLSTVHGCHYCNQGNRSDALAAGLAEADLAAIESDQLDHFCGAERAALKLADQLLLTNAEGALTPELYQELKQHFDDAQIFELGMTLGILAGMARFLFAFDLVEKTPTCPF